MVSQLLSTTSFFLRFATLYVYGYHTDDFHLVNSPTLHTCIRNFIKSAVLALFVSIRFLQRKQRLLERDALNCPNLRPWGLSVALHYLHYDFVSVVFPRYNSQFCTFMFVNEYGEGQSVQQSLFETNRHWPMSRALDHFCHVNGEVVDRVRVVMVDKDWNEI
jgi:hypothetical protein